MFYFLEFSFSFLALKIIIYICIYKHILCMGVLPTRMSVYNVQAVPMVAIRGVYHLEIKLKVTVRI